MDERVGKLLEEDLKERPFVTLRQRCDYVEAISGVPVSRSTMCRAIARIGRISRPPDQAPLDPVWRRYRPAAEPSKSRIAPPRYG
jgi:hypothetical protein